MSAAFSGCVAAGAVIVVTHKQIVERNMLASNLPALPGLSGARSTAQVRLNKCI